MDEKRDEMGRGVFEQLQAKITCLPEGLQPRLIQLLQGSLHFVFGHQLDADLAADMGDILDPQPDVLRQIVARSNLVALPDLAQNPVAFELGEVHGLRQ